MPFLKNAWYVCGFDVDIGDTPVSRTILSEQIVLYRSVGHVVALQDRCPHRLVPLSKGRRIGETIECGYHGLRFDRSGACVFNPHGRAIPVAARVRSYPTLERYGLVWIWMGDPSAAHPSLIPAEFDFLCSAEFTVVRGYLHVKANYQLIIDNILDLSHVPYVHPQFGISGVPPEERIRITEYLFEREGDTVWTRRARHGVPPNDIGRTRYGITCERVNSRTHMHWFAPSMVHFDLGTTECTDAAKDYATPAGHFVTPESELTSHYFFLQARNVAINDPTVDAEMLASTIFAFERQDAPLVEMQQRALGATSDLMAAEPVLLKVDGGPVLARRILMEQIAREGASAEARTHSST